MGSQSKALAQTPNTGMLAIIPLWLVGLFVVLDADTLLCKLSIAAVLPVVTLLVLGFCRRLGLDGR